MLFAVAVALAVVVRKPVLLWCLAPFAWLVNAASPMLDMSNVLSPHNLHLARPGSLSDETHDIYFSFRNQALLNLHFPGILNNFGFPQILLLWPTNVSVAYVLVSARACLYFERISFKGIFMI